MPDRCHAVGLQPEQAMPTVPAAAVMIGAGAFGCERSTTTRTTAITVPTAKVAIDVSGAFLSNFGYASIRLGNNCSHMVTIFTFHLTSCAVPS